MGRWQIPQMAGRDVIGCLEEIAVTGQESVAGNGHLTMPLDQPVSKTQKYWPQGGIAEKIGISAKTGGVGIGLWRFIEAGLNAVFQQFQIGAARFIALCCKP